MPTLTDETISSTGSLLQVTFSRWMVAQYRSLRANKQQSPCQQQKPNTCRYRIHLAKCSLKFPSSKAFGFAYRNQFFSLIMKPPNQSQRGSLIINVQSTSTSTIILCEIISKKAQSTSFIVPPRRKLPMFSRNLFQESASTNYCMRYASIRSFQQMEILQTYSFNMGSHQGFSPKSINTPNSKITPFGNRNSWTSSSSSFHFHRWECQGLTLNYWKRKSAEVSRTFCYTQSWQVYMKPHSFPSIYTSTSISISTVTIHGC